MKTINALGFIRAQSTEELSFDEKLSFQEKEISRFCNDHSFHLTKLIKYDSTKVIQPRKQPWLNLKIDEINCQPKKQIV